MSTFVVCRQPSTLTARIAEVVAGAAEAAEAGMVVAGRPTEAVVDAAGAAGVVEGLRMGAVAVVGAVGDLHSGVADVAGAGAHPLGVVAAAVAAVVGVVVVVGEAGV